jgi:hypothetical protein
VSADQLGLVTWHCSEPDVGLSLGLGDGRILWVGEISSRVHADGGAEIATLGPDVGWWLVLYAPEVMPLARFASAEAARALIDALEAAFKPAR